MTNGPSALVTGANRGIGRATAELLAEAGWHVWLGSRDPVEGAAAAAAITGPGTVDALALDVADDASVAAAAARVEAARGRLDLLVNNAGVFIGGRLGETTAAAFEAMAAVNVGGTARVIAAFVPLLARSERARIVNVTSTTASLELTSTGADLPGNAEVRAAYTATKAALNMLTIQYARDFAADPALAHVVVDAVSPGYAATAMNDHSAPRPASEAAAVVVGVAGDGHRGPGARFLGPDGTIPW